MVVVIELVIAVHEFPLMLQLRDIKIWMTNEHLLKVAFFSFFRHASVVLDRFVQITERSSGLRHLEREMGVPR